MKRGIAPAELARQYDLIVLDHPFAGDIAASGCLLPLDNLIGPESHQDFVGPSLASYRGGDRPVGSLP